MKQYIYADNAATTKLDIDAFEAMKPYLLEDYGNASQPYFFSLKPKRALKEARKTIAECIGALPEEIYFTSGGTESDNWAIKCFGLRNDVRKVYTSEIEHHAVLNANENAVRLSVDSKGIVLPEVLEKAFIPDDYPVPSCLSTLVSVMLVNNEIGTIEPIKELAAVAHAHHALFHTDAVQAVGHIPIDVNELRVDMLSASAHKFNGPKGIGFLYVRKGTLLSPYADGGAQEHGMRAGTENVASIVGMATALKKNCDEMQQTAEKLHSMERTFFDTLEKSNIDFIRNGSDNRVPGNINISIRGASGEMLLHRLDLMGICISTGSACDSVNIQVSHVIKAIGVPQEYAEGTIRISFGRDNKPEDATKVAEAIIGILACK
jgi:cysteine desulfurase